HKMADAYADDGEIIACKMMTEDVSEGVDAVITKRRADWKGR
ncbi:MAG: enoyl-CoA hydratase, partial [Proteobacteria bacterium]|nr:enoyl-CoA hydratase [Pseudomonadota bacterium]